MKQVMIEALNFIFNSQGQWVRGHDRKTIIGKGMYERDLEEQGFSKRLLRRFVEKLVLRRVMLTHQGGWRNAYVLPMPVPEGYDLHAPQAEEVQP